MLIEVEWYDKRTSSFSSVSFFKASERPAFAAASASTLDAIEDCFDATEPRRPLRDAVTLGETADRAVAPSFLREDGVDGWLEGVTDVRRVEGVRTAEVAILRRGGEKRYVPDRRTWLA